MVSILVCQAWRAGSNPVQSFPVSCRADRCGNIALAAELSAVNRMVAGSNPAVPSQEQKAPIMLLWRNGKRS